MTGMNRIRMVGTLAAALTMSFATTSISAQSEGNAKGKEFKGDPYTLETCPVSGQKLGSMGDPVVREYDGREVRFCCKGCIADFEKNQEKYWEKVDEKFIEQQLPWYPLNTCVVSGEELGGMGEPVNLVYRNRLVRFCCAGCKGSFKKDPAKYIAKIDEAVIKKQVEKYPMTTCSVSGEPLDGMGGPLKKVYASRLVQFCCGGCTRSFEKDPIKYFMMIDEAYGDELPSKMHTDDQRKGGHEGHSHGQGG